MPTEPGRTSKRPPTAPTRTGAPATPRVHRSEYPPVTVPSEAIHRLVLDGAAARGDHPALVDGLTGQTITYAQLAHMVDRMAAGFAEEGVRPGDVVALHSPNTVLYPVVYYAASRAGATVTTLSALATAEDVERQLADSKSTLIVTVGALLPVATAGAGAVPVWTMDRVEGHRSVQELLESTGPVPDVPVDAARDVAVLPYSSGTTSLPKGVMLTHASVGVNLEQIHAMHRTGPGDRIVAVLPFFHIYGMTVLMNLPLRHGATVVVLPRFDLTQFLDVLEQHRITRAYVAPPVVLAMAKHPAVDGRDLSSLTFLMSAAAPLNGALAAAAAARLGCEIGQAYGMTELSPGTHLVPDGRAAEAPPASIGQLFPSTEARLVSTEDGRDVGLGEPGEIWIRGPQRMLGYFGLQEETDTLIDADGWLHTGDVGTVDADGWWHVVDRVKELIKYKGYQVAPAELEALLLAHPEVADVAVVGAYDEQGDEIPHAFVVRAPGSDLTAEDVLAHVAERTSPYKRVRRVTFTDAVPKSPSGKILRRELRARQG
ncbi:AMP-binding protein [Modestobacter sp. I12A-02628]|uniref:4-coumarate--CoA ligase family protein n=1 Tax=Goekera deserti TaxID=2497753 RepID=A0A7K3WJ98_9ACTN|nr:AMP-binding protein [Goekera deserti]MPQ97743.1 AMP-binding protein [Goekera deserti]NDI48388.1 AMP-binding protein [Goekera deserti]NEL55989.1 4-coumarate--CoA ligase family protein [Goekera deserti]